MSEAEFCGIDAGEYYAMKDFIAKEKNFNSRDSKERKMKEVQIYTDGACAGNPGPGGWAAILVYGANELVISGSAKRTTNNCMELKAVVEGLKALKEPCKVIVISDSKYVTDAFNKHWVYNWETYNFDGRPNYSLWRELMPLTRRHKVCFKWIRGHAGNPYNERCDKIAVECYHKLMKDN
jgi:ribonuclease HI